MSVSPSFLPSFLPQSLPPRRELSRLIRARHHKRQMAPHSTGGKPMESVTGAAGKGIGAGLRHGSRSDARGADRRSGRVVGGDKSRRTLPE